MATAYEIGRALMDLDYDNNMPLVVNGMEVIQADCLEGFENGFMVLGQTKFSRDLPRKIEGVPINAGYDSILLKSSGQKVVLKTINPNRLLGKYKDEPKEDKKGLVDVEDSVNLKQQMDAYKEHLLQVFEENTNDGI